MNAKHLFLTLIIGALSISVWGDEVHQATDVISTATITAKGYHTSLDDGTNDYMTEVATGATALSGWTFNSQATYAAGNFYCDYTSMNVWGLAKGAAFATTANVSTAAAKSITVSWLNNDEYNIDEGGIKAKLLVYARNSAPYTGKNGAKMDASEIVHTFTYKDGVNLYNFSSDYKYIALVGEGCEYGPAFTSVSIAWQWTEVSTHSVSVGTITGSEYGTVTINPTTAYAGDDITVEFTPLQIGTGRSKKAYSLTKYGYDNMVFDLACGEYVRYDSVLVIHFTMPERDVEVDATFAYISSTNAYVLIEGGKKTITIPSGVETELTFTHLDINGNAISGYTNTITATPDDASIVKTTTPVKVSDGNYKFSVHGLAAGTTTVTVDAPSQGSINAGESSINITVIPRSIALVAKFGDEYYAMKNTLSGNKADGVEVFYDDVNDRYLFAAGTDTTQLKWRGADPAEDEYHIQNPNNLNYFLKYDKGKLVESEDNYEWWKNADGIFTNSAEWGIVYDGSKFLAKSTLENGATDVLLSRFQIMNYSTKSNASIIDTRSLTTGSTGTICVPFDVTDLSKAGADFFTLTGKVLTKDRQKLAAIVTSEEPVTSLEAGHSYVYIMQEGKTAINLNGANAFTTVADKSADDGFVGCLPTDGGEVGKIYVPSGTATYAKDGYVNGCYGYSGGVVRYVQPYATASARNYRAYINAKELEEVKASEVPRRRVIMTEDFEDDLEFSAEEQVATSIDELTDPEFLNWNEPVYNIMGVQVGKDAKGVLIQNGQKFLIQ